MVSLVFSLMRYFFDCPLSTLEIVVIEYPVLCEMLDSVSFMVLY